MNVRDFIITNKIKELKENKFCSCCLSMNPKEDGGYSLCCYEDVVNQELALKFSKRRDIYNFIKLSREVKEFGNLFFNNNAIFKMGNELLSINVSEDINKIIKELTCKI